LETPCTSLYIEKFPRKPFLSFVPMQKDHHQGIMSIFLQDEELPSGNEFE